MLAFVILSIFIFLYFFVAAGDIRQVMLYLLIIAGLYVSLSMPSFGLVFPAAGLLLLLDGNTHKWPLTTAGLVLMLAGTAAVPSYYKRLLKKNKLDSRKKGLALKMAVSELEKERLSAEKEKNTLEEEIEKINQLYVLGRELVEHVELDDVLEHLQRILLNRPGISNVAVFSWGRNSWKILSCSDPEIRDRLHAFIGHQKELKYEKKIKMIHAWDYLPDKTIVFWPIRLERETMSAVVIVSENEPASRYMDEGSIFIPQIEMAMKRTRLFSEVQERSRMDGLTGLYLRRYFIERLQTEIQRAKRYSGSFCLLMLDIDYFKKVNDTYGHLVGDKVLCGVSRILVDCVRPGDLVGRYGGEEFIILMPVCPEDEVLNIAKEINKLISRKEFSAENEKFHVTISIGISCYPRDGQTVDELLANADKALYSVKKSGRNGVEEYRKINPDKKTHKPQNK